MLKISDYRDKCAPDNISMKTGYHYYSDILGRYKSNYNRIHNRAGQIGVHLFTQPQSFVAYNNIRNIRTIVDYFKSTLLSDYRYQVDWSSDETYRSHK